MSDPSWGKKRKGNLNCVNKYSKQISLKILSYTRHLTATPHLRARCTLCKPTLCRDCNAASPTPNWQALSAGSVGGTGGGAMVLWNPPLAHPPNHCVWGKCAWELERGRVQDNWSHCSVQRAPRKLAQVFCQWPAPPHPSPPLFCSSLPPTETSISSPRPDSRSVSPPAPSLHTVSEGWFSRKQTV